MADKTKRFFGDIAPAEKTTFDLLPTAQSKGAPKGALYAFECVDTEVRWGQESENAYVHCQYVVTEPEKFVNRRVFDNIHLTESTVDRTRRMLDTILGSDVTALLPHPLDEQEEAANQIAEAMLGATFVGKVGVEKGSNGYEAKNRIREYSSISEIATAQTTKKRFS